LSKVAKTLGRILRGDADANIRFGDLCALLQHLGFAERVRGDHHIFTRDGVEEILNLQPRGNNAKPYQVKQVRAVLTTYQLLAKPEKEKPIKKKGQTKGKDSRRKEANHGGKR
jgi:hypothetical protein